MRVHFVQFGLPAMIIYYYQLDAAQRCLSHDVSDPHTFFALDITYKVYLDEFG